MNFHEILSHCGFAPLFMLLTFSSKYGVLTRLLVWLRFITIVSVVVPLFISRCLHLASEIHDFLLFADGVFHCAQCTVVQMSQESGHKYWAIRSSARWSARTAHSFACSALLASLAHSAALIRSLARSLTRSRAHGK